MNQKHLRFLDFALIELSQAYPNGCAIHRLADKFKKETKEKIEYEEQKHIEELYQYQYFVQIGTSLHVKILPEIKEIIDSIGSLSEHLKNEQELISDSNNEMELIKELQRNNLQLQNENLEYEKTIRKQKDRIRNIDEQNKFINLIKGYWWLFLIIFGLGIYVRNLFL